ncbi:hypothetical protein JD969_03305 [Planctomycetota bacterium]|nr:hypothetical protein JD969_03305 [Planctomycetota bacterium]
MNKRFGISSLITASMLSLALLAPSASAQSAKRDIDHATFHGVNAGAPIWETNIRLNKQKIEEIASSGTRAIRVNFRLDHGYEQWDEELLKQYDYIINTARAADLQILGLMCNEATSGGQKGWNDTSKGAKNKYVQDFAKNAALLANRYKDSINTWEIWNEPGAWNNPNYVNDPQNAGITYILPEVYAHMLVETNLALRNSRNGNLIEKYDIKLVTGGLFAHDIAGNFSTGSPYIQDVYNQKKTFKAFQAKTGKKYPWDIFGYHFYISQGTKLDPAYLNRYFDDIIKTVRANGDKSNMLITEFGWPTISLDEEGQAENLAITYDVMESRDDVAGSYWYQWLDEPEERRGLIYDNVKNPKKAYIEFQKRCNQK